jgi:hypothetical protein
VLPALGLLFPVEIGAPPVGMSSEPSQRPTRPRGEVGGILELPTNGRFPVSQNEVDMADWVSANVPPEKGLVGLAAFTFTVGKGEEVHIYPVGGGHALPLYGRHYNFRFFSPNTEPDAGAAYREHVSEGAPLPASAAAAVLLAGSPQVPGPLLAAAALVPRRSHGFDADWCLRNDIRYFYATPEGLAKNPGLAWAVAEGALRPVKRFGDSVLYEVHAEGSLAGPGGQR